MKERDEQKRKKQTVEEKSFLEKYSPTFRCAISIVRLKHISNCFFGAISQTHIRIEEERGNLSLSPIAEFLVLRHGYSSPEARI
jgi:hypothetical protein